MNNVKYPFIVDDLPSETVVGEVDDITYIHLFDPQYQSSLPEGLVAMQEDGGKWVSTHLWVKNHSHSEASLGQKLVLFREDRWYASQPGEKPWTRPEKMAGEGICCTRLPATRSKLSATPSVGWVKVSKIFPYDEEEEMGIGTQAMYLITPAMAKRNLSEFVGGEK